jgi:hypothetical protein
MDPVLLMAGKESGEGTWVGRCVREGPRDGERDLICPIGADGKVDDRPGAGTGDVPRRDVL